MGKQDNYDLLRRTAAHFETDVSRETFERFEVYKDLLKEWNEKINLTTIIEDDEIYLKHFADSISIFRLKEISNSLKVIDVGTGAGFPGLPMKILKPELKLTLLDPLNKRINFLKDVADKTGLKEINFIHGRAEDVSRETLYRDSFDLAVSRAVATLPVIAEYCLPFVIKDGYFVALKGPGVSEELKLNKQIFNNMNSELIRIEEVTDLDEYKHNLVLVKKSGSTPSKYPRKTVQIKKDMEAYKNK